MYSLIHLSVYVCIYLCIYLSVYISLINIQSDGGGGGSSECFAASLGGRSVRLGEDGQEAYPRAPPEPVPAPAPASLILTAPAARTRWFPARRFPKDAPEAGPGGGGSAAKRPQGTEAGSERARTRRPRAGWAATQATWENDTVSLRRTA